MSDVGDDVHYCMISINLKAQVLGQVLGPAEDTRLLDPYILIINIETKEKKLYCK